MLRQCEAATLSRLPDPTHSGLDTGHRRREDKRASQFFEDFETMQLSGIRLFLSFCIARPTKTKRQNKHRRAQFASQKLDF